jgi:hypothetical protein
MTQPGATWTLLSPLITILGDEPTLLKIHNHDSARGVNRKTKTSLSLYFPITSRPYGLCSDTWNAAGRLIFLTIEEMNYEKVFNTHQDVVMDTFCPRDVAWDGSF